VRVGLLLPVRGGFWRTLVSPLTGGSYYRRKHSLALYRFLGSSRSVIPAARAARCSYDSERFKRSEPPASEAIRQMLTVKLKHSEGETAHSGEPSGPVKDQPPITIPYLLRSNVSKQRSSVS